MAWKSSQRKLPFNLLSDSSSFDEDEFLLYQSHNNPIDKLPTSPDQSNRKKKKRKKKKKPAVSYSIIPEDPITDTRFFDSNSFPILPNGDNGDLFSENRSNYNGGGSVVCTLSDLSEVTECQTVYKNSGGELRQRNVSSGGGAEEMVSSAVVEEKGMEESGAEVISAETQWSDTNGSSVPLGKLETAESIDWNRLMAKDPNCECLCFLLFRLLVS